MLRAMWSVLWNLGDNVESSAKEGGLACEVSEGSVKTISEPFVLLI